MDQIKLYVKYDKVYPYLPLAVADSKSELARMLGVSLNTVVSSFSHGLETFKEIVIDEKEHVY